jgi:peptide chain release factor subunit 1
MQIVDVSYGGENGFSQAIEASAECLANVKFIQEKKLLSKYFDEIAQDTGRYCFGVDDTLKGLDLGAVETLICWENLNTDRYVLKNGLTGEEVIKYLKPEDLAKKGPDGNDHFHVDGPDGEKVLGVHGHVWRVVLVGG